MTTIRIVAISGSLGAPSRTTLLAQTAAAAVAALVPAEVHLVEIAKLAPLLVQSSERSGLPAAAAAAIALVESADVIVAASPVYRGAYTGLFKHFFDLVDQGALIDVPVVLAATGGSGRHALMVDHVLRPLFSFFRAHTVPTTLYATSSEFDNDTIIDVNLIERIQSAARQAVRLVVRPPAAEAFAGNGSAFSSIPIVSAT
jgi:FMN reductase